VELYRPATGSDERKDGLLDLDTDVKVEVAEYYIGEDRQYAKFLEVGGRMGYVILAIKQYMRKAEVVGAGRRGERAGHADRAGLGVHPELRCPGRAAGAEVTCQVGRGRRLRVQPDRDRPHRPVTPRLRSDGR
jgi:hypothetical protein